MSSITIRGLTMTLDELIDAYRLIADDTVEPYLWSSAEIELYINEAQVEAATRARLLVEDGNATYCSIPTVIGTSTYAIHSLVLEIKYLYLDDVLLPKTTIEELNDEDPEWRTNTELTTRWYQAGQAVSIVPTPTEIGAITMVVVRQPITIVDALDIPERYHMKMLDWALALGFRKRDTDTAGTPDQPPSMIASQFESRFEKTFGPATDARVQHNELNYRITTKNSWNI